MMNTPKSPTADSADICTTHTVTPENWFKLIDLIDDEVTNVTNNIHLDPKTTYLVEWDEVCTDLHAFKNVNPKGTYLESTTTMFGDPETLYDYFLELVHMVPPLKSVITATKLKPYRLDHIKVSIKLRTDELVVLQNEQHLEWLDLTVNLPPPDSPDEHPDNRRDQTSSPPEIDISTSTDPELFDKSMERIAPDLKQQVDAMQNTLDNLPGTISDTLNDKIKAAIMEAMDTITNRTQETILEANTALKQSIRDGNTAVDKLTGDLKNANTTIDNIRQQTRQLTTQARTSTDDATKAFLNAKQAMEKTGEEIMHDIQQAKTWIVHESAALQTATRSDYHKRDYPDEYKIQNQTVQIRSKKYQEDQTTISCKSPDTLMLVYEQLVELSSQYGIHITPPGLLRKWMDPEHDPAPTFPYSPQDFDSKEKCYNAYTTMKLAIATKLKTAIKFDTTFHAAKLIIHEHATDGYIMLYNLMTIVHPRLIHNKAMRPVKPKFNGDMHHYITAYRSWIEYNLQRQQPHIYDHDEIAEDIITAIKSSTWARNLKDGLERAELTLDRWKNDTRTHTPFPTELRLDFITQTILQYYIERNIDPFSRDTNRPTARALYGQQRGRTPYRGTSRGRNQSYSRSNSSQRSNRDYQLRQCNVCGGQHRTDTIGCPHLVKQHHINKFIATHGDREVQQLVRETEDSRSRSQSKDSQRSQRSQTPTPKRRDDRN